MPPSTSRSRDFSNQFAFPLKGREIGIPQNSIIDHHTRHISYNANKNLSATTIASSVYSLSQTDNKVFNAMVVTNVTIGRVTPQLLFQCSSLLSMAKPVVSSVGCWTGLSKIFDSCSFLMHVVQIVNHQYHLLLLRVPSHILQLPPYANQTIRALEMLSFSLLHFFK